jgi:hypothetical protein
MTRIKAIPTIQAAKVCGLTGLMLGAISSCVGLLVILVISTESPIVTLTALISLPFVGALAGFGGTALVCTLYNYNARWFGGMRLDLEEETVATRGTLEESAGPAPNLAAAEVGLGDAFDRRESGRVDREKQTEVIRLYRLKLGPTGADRPSTGTQQFRQPGDWVDVRNEGPSATRINGLCLYHLEHLGPGTQPEYRFIVTLPECSLKPGEVLRLHSGPRRDLALLYAEDRNGADWHVFTSGESHFWNRRDGDTALLYAAASKETTDVATFDPNPPEGVVLWRQGDRFAGKHINSVAGQR